jgi:AraC family transcriptional regulator
MNASIMPVPETTSAENLFRYVGGKCLATSRGEAWREIKASVIALPPVVDALRMPSVSEPVLCWIRSGEVEVQERENGGPWLTNRVKKGAFFLPQGARPMIVVVKRSTRSRTNACCWWSG